MKKDIYQTVTDTVIEAMEAGTVPWSRDWHQNGQPLDMPTRSCGVQYRGINVLMLWIAGMSRGYDFGEWMTFNQAKDMGANVRKGERGTKVVYYGTLERGEGDDTETVRFLKAYTVFNVAQIDNLPEQRAPDHGIDTGARAKPDMQAFFDRVGAQIVHTGAQPCYDPSADLVRMPYVHQFDTADAYYGTLAHELVHWTGHTSRLDRLKKFGNKSDYAFEELVAELGACFLTAQVGGAPDVTRSAAYIESWLKALKSDKKFIFQAASAAQAACDYVMLCAKNALIDAGEESEAQAA